MLLSFVFRCDFFCAGGQLLVLELSVCAFCSGILCRPLISVL